MALQGKGVFCRPLGPILSLLPGSPPPPPPPPPPTQSRLSKKGVEKEERQLITCTWQDPATETATQLSISIGTEIYTNCHSPWAWFVKSQWWSRFGFSLLPVRFRWLYHHQNIKCLLHHHPLQKILSRLHLKQPGGQ